MREEVLAPLGRETRALGEEHHTLVGLEAVRERADASDLGGVADAAPHERVGQTIADQVEAGIPEQLALEHVAQAERVEQDAAAGASRPGWRGGPAPAPALVVEQPFVRGDVKAEAEDPAPAVKESTRPTQRWSARSSRCARGEPCPNGPPASVQASSDPAMPAVSHRRRNDDADHEAGARHAGADRARRARA